MGYLHYGVGIMETQHQNSDAVRLVLISVYAGTSKSFRTESITKSTTNTR